MSSPSGYKRMNEGVLWLWFVSRENGYLLVHGFHLKTSSLTWVGTECFPFVYYSYTWFTCTPTASRFRCCYLHFMLSECLSHQHSQDMLGL